MKKYNVCIVGGGSTYTLGFLKSFARMQKEFPLNKLVLFDFDHVYLYITIYSLNRLLCIGQQKETYIKLYH